MKKKRLLFLLLIIFVSLFMPTEVFAKDIYSSYNTNIDYQFFVDEDNENAGNLKFKLYDKTGELSFESEYDSSLKKYFIFVNDQNFNFIERDYNGIYYNMIPWRPSDLYIEPGIREYVPYFDQFNRVMDFDEMKSFLNQNNLYYKWKSSYSWIDDYSSDGGYDYEFNVYTYLPMILEVKSDDNDLLMKKIVLASVNIRCDYFKDPLDAYSYMDVFYITISLINNTSYWNQENQYIFGSNFLENVDFMRKTVLDYTDELWEELNNGPIASTEISNNNKASANYRYVNQSISTGKRNVPEETIEDYADSLPVFSFKKTDSIDEKEHNPNVADVIMNPKTWNNGVIILVISIIVIIGSSIFIIRKKVSR